MTALTRRNGNGTPPAAMPLANNPVALGEVLARSGFFQDSRDAAQAAVKVMAGQEMGFGPVASMTGVYIVKGRVTISANLMAAAIKRHPSYTYRVREHTETACVIDFIEQGEVIGTSSFTWEDAQKGGLTGSATWKNYPRNMLFARALSNGAKWYCPDVFGGPIYTPDELGAEVDGESGEVVNAPAVATAPAAAQIAPAEPEPAIDAERATDIGLLIHECDQAGVITSKDLGPLFLAAGATPTKINPAAVAALTVSQADYIERELRSLLPAADDEGEPVDAEPVQDGEVAA